MQTARLGAGRAALRPAARRGPPGRAPPAEPGDPALAAHPLPRRPGRRLPGGHQRGRRHEPAPARARRRLGGAAGGRRRPSPRPCARRCRTRTAANDRAGARELLQAFTWDRALAPLVRFCREPRRDETKERFVPPARDRGAARTRCPSGLSAGFAAAGGSRVEAVEGLGRHPLLERPPPPGDLPRGARRPAAIPASTGRSWSSTTARPTAPPTGCGETGRGRRGPPDREPGEPRLLRRQQPPGRRGVRRRRRGPAQQRHPPASPAGSRPWWTPCARRRPDVAAVSGKIVDWEGERLDFGRGVMTFDGHAFQLDFRRPLDRARVPAAGEELLFACGGNMLIRAQLVPGGRRLRREPTSPTWRTWTSAGACGPAASGCSSRPTRWCTTAPAPRATSWASSTAASSSSATPS